MSDVDNHSSNYDKDRRNLYHYHHYEYHHHHHKISDDIYKNYENSSWNLEYSVPVGDQQQLESKGICQLEGGGI